MQAVQQAATQVRQVIITVGYAGQVNVFNILSQGNNCLRRQRKMEKIMYEILKEDEICN